ncbi:MAG TPA: Rdx family protein [Acetobacteraceae bacterium]
MPDADIALRKSSGGVFEITVDGRLRFSKKREGRFPTDAEITESVS